MGHKDDVERFNDWAPRYEQSWAQKYIDRAHEVMLNLVERQNGQVNPNSVLDVGCGTGRLLRKVGEKWPSAELSGVDAAETMIEVARRLKPSARFMVGHAESLPVPDGSIDLVVTSFSFHHWKDQIVGMREVVRVLRPGGCFCLVDVVYPSWLPKIFRHRKSSDAATLREMFVQNGLELKTQQQILAKFAVVMLGRKSLPT